jgi:fibro-slime domain-containing protein
MQKTLPIFVIALIALFSSAFAQVKLDIIYRDFPVTAPGFEEFLGCDDKGNDNSKFICWNSDGYYACDGPANNSQTHLKVGRCRNNGSPRLDYSTGPEAFNCPNNDWEYGSPTGDDGYVKVTTNMVHKDLFYDKANCDLEQDDPEEGQDRDHIKYRYCARPQGFSEVCGSSPAQITNWFSNSANAKEFRDVIQLDAQSDGTFLIEHNANKVSPWGCGTSDFGFFPLDKYDTGCSEAGKFDTWGRQSLNYWCPCKTGDNYANCTGTRVTYDLNAICPTWRNNGGPKSETAARATAGNSEKFHNYGFSAAGSGTFIYDPTKDNVFEFTGDDDMWIFIDGKLAVDLGGVHQAAPAKINIKQYAEKTGPWAGRDGEAWVPDSYHSINFFYMDRNTDGSNFKLKMALNGLSESVFGAPFIKKAETTVDGENVTTQLYVSAKLDLDDIKRRFVGTTDYGIIVKDINDPAGKTICVYRIESIEYKRDGKSEGQIYEMTGTVVCKNGERRISGGDSLSFNVQAYDGSGQPNNNFSGYNNDYGLSATTEPIKSSAGKPADKITWAPNSNKIKMPEFNPTVPDDDPKKPPFHVDQMFDGGSGRGSGGSSGPIGNISGNTGGVAPPNLIASAPSTIGTRTDVVNSFGAIGNTLPSNRTGELILTAYPSPTDPMYKTYIDGKFFGLPPSSDPNCANGLCGIADPSSQNKVNGAPNGGVTGGFAFVKNGWSNKEFNEGSVDGSLQLSPTRCVATINGEKASINCLSFNIPAVQPFQIAVTVYDQLGNFVTQYRETVTEEEFRYVTQGPNYSSQNTNYMPNASGKCKNPLTDPSVQYGDKNAMTTSGIVNVNVNIYPFSQTGRKFGNGVYIVKVDRVDMPFEGCFNNGGTADWGEYSFIRYHTDLRFGWMRAAP